MRLANPFLCLIVVCCSCGAGHDSEETRLRQEAQTATVSATDLVSRCTLSPLAVECPRNMLDLPVDLTGLIRRRVYYQVPLGTPPTGGWPTVLLFQGTGFSAELSFAGIQGEPFGAYYQTLTVKELLDAGFAVLAPRA